MALYGIVWPEYLKIRSQLLIDLEVITNERTTMKIIIFGRLRMFLLKFIQEKRSGLLEQMGLGKSTLLKILSRITDPTEGRVEIYGRVGSLLEVGTGFHPELTGRENLFLSGAILGMKKTEIIAKLDEIIAFSGLEKFVDTR